MYDIKNIYEAYTIKEASKILKDKPHLRIIAGGTDVLVKIREGKMADTELLSIQLIDELREIEILDNGDIKIGALNTFTHIADNKIIKDHIPQLGQAVLTAGGPQLRNAATIGGNVCNAAPSADAAPILFTLEAVVEIVSLDEIRYMDIKDFYIGLGQVDLREGEFVKSFIIKKENYEGYLGYYYKYATRNAMDIALSSCGVGIKLDDDLKIEKIKACYGVASTVPIRASEAEKAFEGKTLDEDTIKEFAKAALKELSPRNSWRGSKVLRTQVLYEICVRSLRDCLKQKKGNLNA